MNIKIQKILIVVFAFIALGLSLSLITFAINGSQSRDISANEQNPKGFVKFSEIITDNISKEIVEENSLEITPEIEASLTPTITKTVTPTVSKTVTPAPTTKVVTAIPTVAPTTVVPTTVVIDNSIPRQVSPGCPATTQSCVPCTSGTYCRFEAGYTNYGFLGWSCQNNNPGNIRPSSYRNVIILRNGGSAYCGVRTDAYGRGDYMIFKTYTEGFNSLKAYLKGIANGEHSSYNGIVDGVYEVCGNCGLKLFSAKYVGTTIEAQDDSNSYANRIANKLRIDINTTTFSWIVANKLDSLANAIKVNEGWYGN